MDQMDRGRFSAESEGRRPRFGHREEAAIYCASDLVDRLGAIDVEPLEEELPS